MDEVLGLFIRGFADFLEARGYEFRLDRFALFQNIYRPGAQTHLDLEAGQKLYDDFFGLGCGEMEPVPGAAEALARLSARAGIVALSNAPAQARPLRAAWLKRHGLDYPLILNVGPKGPMTPPLAAQTPRRTAFVDDLLPNLDSVTEHAGGAATFQHVADERLRPLAPTAPDRHRRIDDWVELGEAIETALAQPSKP